MTLCNAAIGEGPLLLPDDDVGTPSGGLECPPDSPRELPEEAEDEGVAATDTATEAIVTGKPVGYPINQKGT